MASLHALLEQEKPQVIALVETHIGGRCQIKIPEYGHLESRNRMNKGGGGIMIGVRDNSGLSMLITHTSEKHEQTWINLKSKENQYRICVAYSLVERDKK